jgi:hypothetical protein
VRRVAGGGAGGDENRGMTHRFFFSCVSPNDSKKMARLTGQRGAEGAALYHRASSSSGLHHGAQAAPVKAA